MYAPKVVHFIKKGGISMSSKAKLNCQAAEAAKRAEAKKNNAKKNEQAGGKKKGKKRR
jgi:hypothetical protein